MSAPAASESTSNTQTPDSSPVASAQLQPLNFSNHLPSCATSHVALSCQALICGILLLGRHGNSRKPRAANRKTCASRSFGSIVSSPFPLGAPRSFPLGAFAQIPTKPLLKELLT